MKWKAAYNYQTTHLPYFIFASKLPTTVFLYYLLKTNTNRKLIFFFNTVVEEKMYELILSFHILLLHLVVPVLYHISGPKRMGQVVRKLVKEYEIQSDHLHLTYFYSPF